MTVGQLRDKLEDVDDDALVVMGGSDHSYVTVSGSQGLAESNGGGYWEYYSEGDMVEDSVVIDVFVIH